MKNLFIQYPKCTTCKKAMKYLENNSIEFDNRHIVEENPSKEELKEWISRSGLEVKKFFNTSGLVYREMELKDKIKSMSDDEMLELLGSNGMLVKRPLLITKDRILVGFKEKEYEELFTI